MREKDRYERIRRKKIGWFSLRTRLTLTVGLEIAVCVLAAYFITMLLERIIPRLTEIPDFIAVLVISLLIAVAVTRPLSRIFFKPVKNVREAMRTISDGNFDIRLETDSSSVEIQELYAGFNMMAQDLSTNEMLQSDFVSNVSHELKTPISAIEGNATLLADGELTESQAELVGDILEDARRLSGLIANMLLLTKVDHQGIARQRTGFSLDEQIRQCIIALERSWTKKETDFDVDMEAVDYRGNETLLGHVWSNLIENAVKFGPQNGLIRIRLFAENGRIVFTIEDEGPGIPEHSLERVFDRFYQADSSHQSEGSGLGLALARQIVLLEGGTIAVENKPDGGCRFTVELNAGQ